MTDDRTDDKEGAGKTPDHKARKADREARLAEALRANLRRRKAAARATTGERD